MMLKKKNLMFTTNPKNLKNGILKAQMCITKDCLKKKCLNLSGVLHNMLIS